MERFLTNVELDKAISSLEEIYNGGPRRDLFRARPLLGEYIEKLKAARLAQKKETPLPEIITEA